MFRRAAQKTDKVFLAEKKCIIEPKLHNKKYVWKQHCCNRIQYEHACGPPSFCRTTLNEWLSESTRHCACSFNFPTRAEAPAFVPTVAESWVLSFKTTSGVEAPLWIPGITGEREWEAHEPTKMEARREPEAVKTIREKYGFFLAEKKCIIEPKLHNKKYVWKQHCCNRIQYEHACGPPSFCRTTLNEWLSESTRHCACPFNFPTRAEAPAFVPTVAESWVLSFKTTSGVEAPLWIPGITGEREWEAHEPTKMEARREPEAVKTIREKYGFFLAEKKCIIEPKLHNKKYVWKQHCCNRIQYEHACGPPSFCRTTLNEWLSESTRHCACSFNFPTRAEAPAFVPTVAESWVLSFKTTSGVEAPLWIPGITGEREWEAHEPTKMEARREPEAVKTIREKYGHMVSALALFPYDRRHSALEVNRVLTTISSAGATTGVPVDEGAQDQMRTTKWRIRREVLFRTRKARLVTDAFEGGRERNTRNGVWIRVVDYYRAYCVLAMTKRATEVAGWRWHRLRQIADNQSGGSFVDSRSLPFCVSIEGRRWFQVAV